MVVEILIDNGQLSKEQQSQIGRQVQQIKRIMHKLGKDQTAIRILQPKPEGETTIKGIEKIISWAIREVKPQHLESFLILLGNDICNVLFAQHCKVCPAKKYQGDMDRCHKALGKYCITDFPKEGGPCKK